MTVNIDADRSAVPADAPATLAPMDLCCMPVTGGVLTEDDAEELAAVLKVLAEPARLRLLSLVASAGEACACDLVEPVGRSQPTVSHHLTQLVDAGLLRRERRGRWAWYRIVPERLEAVRRALAPSDESGRPEVGGAD